MNENAIRHRVERVERELRRILPTRRESDDAAIEPGVYPRADGLFDWHTACGTLVLGFDPDGTADMSLTER